MVVFYHTVNRDHENLPHNEIKVQECTITYYIRTTQMIWNMFYIIAAHGFY